MVISRIGWDRDMQFHSLPERRSESESKFPRYQCEVRCKLWYIHSSTATVAGNASVRNVVLLHYAHWCVGAALRDRLFVLVVRYVCEFRTVLYALLLELVEESQFLSHTRHILDEYENRNTAWIGKWVVCAWFIHGLFPWLRLPPSELLEIAHPHSLSFRTAPASSTILACVFFFWSDSCFFSLLFMCGKHSYSRTRYPAGFARRSINDRIAFAIWLF